MRWQVNSPTGTVDKSSASILIAEDERIVARDLEQRLIALNYDVVATVATGEGAVERVRTLKPDLALMDVRLAGRMDGVEAVRIIRSVQDIPVIYLTALVDDDTLSRAKRTDPSGYLVKPFNQSQLRCAVELALYSHQVSLGHRPAETPTDAGWIDDVSTLAAVGRVESSSSHRAPDASLRIVERRDPDSRVQLRNRVRLEFDEMPGMILTVAQAARLFGIRRDVCVRVLGELIAEGLISERNCDRYGKP